ncbi:hypothetical protein IJS77_02635 [bacterium]|nr:hypothetical protein [bacterium]
MNFQQLFSQLPFIGSIFSRGTFFSGRLNGSNSLWWQRQGGCQQMYDSPDKEVAFQPQQQTQGCQQKAAQLQSCGCQQQQPVQQECNPQPTVDDGCGCGGTTPTQTVAPSPTVDDCPGYTCRHTPKPSPTPTCTCPEPTPSPTPTCTCPEPTPSPTPSCTCPPQQTKPICPPAQPQMPTVVDTNINTGIIDGPGNDTYDGPGNDVYAWGNRGIIDTNGNDIYAQNYSINTFNTINNFYGPQPSPTATVEPSPTPTTPTPTTPTPTTPTPTTPTPTVPTPTPTPPDPTVTPTAEAINLTPLRNLLTGIEKLTPDGVLSDAELAKAMANPHYADLDGNPNAISSQEMAIFNRIKSFNQDKDLISNVLKGDYSNIDESTLEQLGALSDEIKNLTENR